MRKGCSHGHDVSWCEFSVLQRRRSSATTMVNGPPGSYFPAGTVTLLVYIATFHSSNATQLLIPH